RVPLICVHRTSGDDPITEQLVSGEPAYLIIPSKPRAALQAIKVLRAVVAQLSQYFGSCLVVEVWGNPAENLRPKTANGDGHALVPPYEVFTPATRIPRAAIEALSKSLGRDILPYGGTRVILSDFDKLAPPGARSLLRPRDCRELNSFPLAI